MTDVFLSYSREDEKDAARFAEVLTAAGLSVWWDSKIPPGKTWDQVIGKALAEAKCVVVLWTETSVASDWVKEEASRGARRRALVPVRVDNVELPLGFGRIEAAELSRWNGDPADAEFRSFLVAVQELVDRPLQIVDPPRATKRYPSTRRRLLWGGAALLALLAGILSWLALDRKTEPAIEAGLEQGPGQVSPSSDPEEETEVSELRRELEALRNTVAGLSESTPAEPTPTELASTREERPELFQDRGEDRPAMAGKLWPVGTTLRIQFLEGTPEQHLKVEEWARPWLDHVNLRWEFSDDPEAEIRISFDSSGGAWAFVGTDALATPAPGPTMNLGWVDPGTVLHQFGHVLGFIHEHQSPNSGIDWDEETVVAALTGPPNMWSVGTVRANVLDAVDPELYAGYRDFDPDSVMMYSFPAEWTRNAQGFKGGGNQLTDGDASFAALLYPATEPSS